MTITQQPVDGSMYFQKSVPDVLMQIDQGDYIYSNSVKFELRVSNFLVLSEKYIFDTNNAIRIRNIAEVIEKFFEDLKLILSCSITVSWDDDGEPFSFSSTFKVLKCESTLTNDASSWTAVNFLTRTYLEKRTSKTNNEFLSFLQKSTYAGITKHFKLYYLSENLPVEVAGTLGTIAAVGADQITTFNSSLAAVLTAAAVPSTLRILQYDIWLTGLNFETNKYTYLVDNRIYRNEKKFLFINSFGVLETFTTTGICEVIKSADYNIANIQGNYKKISQDFVVEKILNSGFLSDVEMEWIDDFLLSSNAGIYTNDNDIIEQITIVEIDKKEIDNNQLQYFTFNFRKTKNNHLSFAKILKGIFDLTFDETFE